MVLQNLYTRKLSVLRNGPVIYGPTEVVVVVSETGVETGVSTRVKSEWRFGSVE